MTLDTRTNFTDHAVGRPTGTEPDHADYDAANHDATDSTSQQMAPNLEPRPQEVSDCSFLPKQDDSSSESGIEAAVDHIDVDVCSDPQAPRVLHLSANCIKESRWANRHSTSYLSAEYTALVKAIKLRGSNIQPIKVRKIDPPNGQHSYEVVFGHRRLKACQELGIPVRAIVADQMSDRQMYLEMQAENQNRDDLSAWEQGKSFQAALDCEMYSSARELAKATGVSPGLVSKALAIARLPQEVLDAFDQLQDIQYRFLTPLQKALEEDPKGVSERARSLAIAKDKILRTGKEVCNELTGLVPSIETSEQITVDNRTVAIMKKRKAKGETIEFLEPLGARRKQKVVFAIQALFSDAVT